MSFEQRLKQIIDQRQQANLYRFLRCNQSSQGIYIERNGKQYLNFCSNDYLGLANHPTIIEAFHEAAKHHGLGSGSAHLICGHHQLHQQLEKELADFVKRPKALLFSTGYMANLGIGQALLQKNDIVLEDKLNHASLIDAARISAARLIRYQHTNMDDLQTKLSNYDKPPTIVLTDGMFSMDGDQAPLKEIATLAKQHNAYLAVDDAHGIGVVGPQGRGSVLANELSTDDIPILMGTFGKALGTFGAFVAGSELLIDALIQQARTFIYTTALPPAIAAATSTSLKLVKQADSLRNHLHTLSNYFRECFHSQQDRLPKNWQLMESSTPIQPLLVHDEKQALELSQSLEIQSILITPIRYPTVPKNQARLRITFSAKHNKSHIDQLIDALINSTAKTN